MNTQQMYRGIYLSREVTIFFVSHLPETPLNMARENFLTKLLWNAREVALYGKNYKFI